MFQMSLPFYEFIIRAIIVYAFLMISLRLTGKRQVGQLSPFDFVLLLILSNAVQNSMNGGDNSLIGGLISAFSLICVNWLLGFLSYRNRKLDHFIDGKPEILIHNGRLYESTLEQEKITREELNSVLRRNGVIRVEDVRFAMLEANGDISVIAKDKKDL